MSLRSVIDEWLAWGVEPGRLILDADNQREFAADVMQSEKEWLIDALAESLTRRPASAAKLIEAFRQADALQVGAVIDDCIRWYVFEHCGDYWEAEFTMAHEQNSDYAGDE